ncbi:MAG: hypothetical protein ACT4RN_09505 [Pseudonocardia sp.]
MALLGEAVQHVCAAHDPRFRRVNYQILGNAWPHLHAHVHPRYDWEPAQYRDQPVWTYPDRDHPRHLLDHRHAVLQADLAGELARIATAAYG